MKAPMRALVVEDIESWAYTLSRAARRAGASEITTCADLESLHIALQRERFDIALIDIGLDPDDDTDSGGVRAVEMIREIDGPSTRCVLVTGWQGDRMDLQATLMSKHGVDWAYMKEKYDAHVVISKLTELLEGASERRVAASTPMANLAAEADGMRFQSELLDSFAPRLRGDINTLYVLAATLLEQALPLVAKEPRKSMYAPDGLPVAGMYWSRALGTAVAVELTTSAPDVEEHDEIKATLTERFALPLPPELLSQASRRNLRGRLWELPGVPRTSFPG